MDLRINIEREWEIYHIRKREYLLLLKSLYENKRNAGNSNLIKQKIDEEIEKNIFLKIK